MYVCNLTCLALCSYPIQKCKQTTLIVISSVQRKFSGFSWLECLNVSKYIIITDINYLSNVDEYKRPVSKLSFRLIELPRLLRKENSTRIVK